MRPMGSNEEHNFSLSFAKVVVNSDQSASEDSFSSSPGTNFNQGASRFISLVEKQLEALKNLPSSDAPDLGLLFERVVVDMMDLGLEDGILSSTDIPGVLEKKGWDFGQVAAAWKVSSEPLQWDSWSFRSLDYLGGERTPYLEYGVFSGRKSSLGR